MIRATKPKQFKTKLAGGNVRTQDGLAIQVADACSYLDILMAV
jgi:hypothetical protein